MSKKTEAPIKEKLRKKQSRTGKEDYAKTLDNIPNLLPKEKAAQYIQTKNLIEGKKLAIDISSIATVSKQLYVNDIHSANPEILAKNFILICPNTPHVTLRIPEKDYMDLLNLPAAKKIKKLVTVIDLAVFPSLTYGPWHLQDIKDVLPDADQIADYDAEFKKRDVFFHNQSVYGFINEHEDEDEELLLLDDEEEEEEMLDFSDEEEHD